MIIRRIIAVILLLLAAFVLMFQLSLTSTRSPASITNSKLIKAEFDGDLEILYSTPPKRILLFKKRERIGKVNIDRIMRQLPIYSNLLSNNASTLNPKIVTKLIETNNRLVLALQAVAREKKLNAIVREGSRIETSEFISKYQEFQDVTDHVLIKMGFTQVKLK